MKSALLLDRKTAAKLNPLIDVFYPEGTLNDAVSSLRCLSDYLVETQSLEEVKREEVWPLLNVIVAALDYERENLHSKSAEIKAA